MRIIGGKYKRRRFDVPKTFNARPTTDFAKENLFNVLDGLIDWEGCHALDLFGGTGSITMELISRGCEHVTTVEKRREHARFILDVADKLGERKKLLLIQNDVAKAVKMQQSKSMQYGFIFADPPYGLEWLGKLPVMITGIDFPEESKEHHTATDELAINSKSLLRENGIFVLEHPGSYSFEKHPLFLQHREYGSVNFTIFGRIE
ncbi:Ribosomal RNA small subunit methyltransferase D [Porphyromonas macacae]|uniref:Ribosomal RNA small subunit methyltransferase D n=1 Tax=Porphyromonas macacae TaxID=28115 RepID=A0A379EBX9_9PORP|nr:RsmD family RNA methyltransferase [Porphyromonas macacae]SUB89891.1 Ribosomal RNA small subunit methyltransferase D [Porphyromonas macacae]